MKIITGSILPLMVPFLIPGRAIFTYPIEVQKINQPKIAS
tara:strand:+ start:35596 stop:35715 length:120 start_codon:yes stop_codon:yes gene_type:complete